MGVDSRSLNTVRLNPLEILGHVAEQALDEGRVRDAEQTLSEQLEYVLADAKAGNIVPSAVVDLAARLALRLARTAREPRWLDYAIDLLESKRASCTPELAAALVATLTSLPALELRALDRYAQKIRGLPRNAGTVAAGRQIERMRDSARARSR